MKIPRKNNLKNNKFPISTNVYDTFSELSYDEKWSGAIGEPTSCPGFQKWTRHKTYKEKLLTINTTVIPNVTRLQ